MSSCAFFAEATGGGVSGADADGDTTPGAAEALERAVASASGAAFREEALARLTQVYAELGKVEACARAKARYLESYPSGAQRDAVSRRCGAP